MEYTNVTGVSLSTAVFLVDDDYDHNDDPNVISATQLIKPIKATILGMRVDQSNLVLDVNQCIPRAVGTALHNAVEAAWTQRHIENMVKDLQGEINNLKQSNLQKDRLIDDLRK